MWAAQTHRPGPIHLDLICAGSDALVEALVVRAGPRLTFAKSTMVVELTSTFFLFAPFRGAGGTGSPDDAEGIDHGPRSEGIGSRDDAEGIDHGPRSLLDSLTSTSAH